MDWIDDSVAAFGRELGIAHLQLNSRGVVNLSIAPDSALTLEFTSRRDHPEIVVAMSRRVGFELERRLLVALHHAHVMYGPGVPVQLALGGSGVNATLIGALRVSARTSGAQELLQATTYLSRWLEAVMNTEVEGG